MGWGKSKEKNDTPNTPLDDDQKREIERIQRMPGDPKRDEDPFSTQEPGPLS